MLGIDLRRDAKVARAETKSLAKALAARETARRRWRGVSFAAVALVLLSAFALRHGIGHNEKTGPLEQRCEQNDVSACVALADLVSVKDAEDVPVNLRRAAKLYQRGCDANFGHACARLAAAYRDDDWKGRDQKRARELEDRACALGEAASCRR